MPPDPFATLGLTPGHHEPAVIRDRFEARRDQLLRDLACPQRYLDSRVQLESLYVAYRTLRDRDGQSAALRSAAAREPLGILRRMIEASIEDGLLRHSRREAILQRAAELGVHEFQAQLLIASTLVGLDDDPAAGLTDVAPHPARARRPVWTRELIAVGGLAAVLFLLLTRLVS